MKRPDSHVDFQLYAAYFKDLAAWDASLCEALSKDLLRIENLTASRGLSFIMIDLPEACKIVDHALSTGNISSHELPATFGRVVHDGSRVFLRCLFEKVFSQDGSLLDGDSTSIFFLRQTLLLSKKVKEDCEDAAILEEVEQFASVDNRCFNPTLDWASDRLYTSVRQRLSFRDGYRHEDDLASPRHQCPIGLLDLCDRVSANLSSRFGELDWRSLEPRHGPGSVADAKTGTDKYQFPNWPKKLENTFPQTYYGQSREDLHRDGYGQDSSLHEPPARLLAVPKTLKGPRMIASEPIAHQFLQLGLMQWIRQNMPDPLRACIDFTSQEPSKQMCLEASRTGSSATIDLSAASDRLSCWVVERAFEANPPLLIALHACRTRWLVNATGVGERYFLRLKKFAAMGSGVTFPVQTIVYAYCAIACVLYVEGKNPSYRNIQRAAERVRVFGDDIICPTQTVEHLVSLLTHLGLKVNETKSHYQGLFRESCGMDAYSGDDITPMYLQSLALGTTPESLVSWIDVSNNAYSKGLWALSEYMVTQIPEKTRSYIPICSDNLGCLTLLTYGTPSYGRVKFNSQLHRKEVLGLKPKASVSRGQRDDHQNLLQFFVERPSPETNWSAGYLVKTSLRLRRGWSAIYG